MTPLRFAALAVALALGVAEAAEPVVHVWTQSNASNANTTPSANINGWTFYAVNDALHARDTASGSYLAQPYTTGGPIDSFPTPVQLKDGKWYVFVASTDGKLYKFDVQASINNPGMPMQVAITAGTPQIRDLKRSSSLVCVQKDSLLASPTVQLVNYSGGTPYSLTKDIVIVPTYHGCNSTTTNKIYALDAADITATPVWIFNDGGEYQVDYFSEGCSLDYTRAQIYCGSNLAAGRFQNTVWALSTNTGSAIWAVNSNSVHNRPQLGRGAPEHLYVGDMIGRLHALNPVSGHEDWAFALTGVVGVSVTQNIWAEFRNGYDHLIFATDSTGSLRTVYDGGSNPGDGSILWSRNFGASPKITSLGSVSPTLGKVYVGLDNGTVHQLDLSNGADEGYKVISGAASTASNTVTDPTLHLSNGATDINRMIASSWGTAGSFTKSFAVPFAVSNGQTPPTPCLLANNPADPDLADTFDGCDKNFDIPYAGCGPTGCCAVGRCAQDPAQPVGNGFCYSAPTRPNGTGAPNGWKVDNCDDGQASCTTNKVCVGGACRGTWSATCIGAQNCGRDPRACGPGKVCYIPNLSAGPACVDVDGASTRQDFASYSPCGSMTRTCANSAAVQGGATWGGERQCVAGVCRRAVNDYCDAPSALQIQNQADQYGNRGGTYASGLSFSRIPNQKSNTPGSCAAYLSTYQFAKGYSSGNIGFGPSSGACPVCGVLYQCLNTTAGTACADGVTKTFVTSNNFNDPTGGFAVPTRMHVTIQGEGESCTAASVNVWVQNLTTGGYIFMGTASTTNPICACNACNTNMFELDLVNQAGIPGYNLGGPMLVYVQASTGTSDISLANVTVNLGNNYMRKVLPLSSTTNAYPANFVPAFMHGIAIGEPSNGASVSDVFTAILNDPTGTGVTAIGRYNNDSSVVNATPNPLPVATTPAATERAFTIPAFDYGPSQPASDGLGPANSGRIYYGNYLANGDLYQIIRGYSASPVMTLPGSGRISALDYPAPVIPAGGGASLSDNLIRVARRNTATGHAELLFISTLVTATLKYTLDLNSPCPPSDSGTGGVGLWAAGQCAAGDPIQPGRGFENIVAIQSVSVDPLNGTNDTYLEVTESRGGNTIHYLLMVTPDHAVRPVADYFDVKGNTTYQGVLSQLDPTLTQPPQDFGVDGRITTAQQGQLYRLIPVDPAGAVNLARVNSYSLSP